MACCLLFIPQTSGPVSITFITVLGIYLGLDIAGMITKTSQLPKGEYKKISVHKYIISTICLMILVVLSLVMKDKADMNTALTSFCSATMIICGCLLGGLEGNKIATSYGSIQTVADKEVKNE